MGIDEHTQERERAPSHMYAYKYERRDGVEPKMKSIHGARWREREGKRIGFNHVEIVRVSFKC